MKNKHVYVPYFSIGVRPLQWGWRRAGVGEISHLRKGCVDWSDAGKQWDCPVGSCQKIIIKQNKKSKSD